MAKEISPAPLGKTPTRESSYWFAHSGPEDGTQPDPKAGGDSRDKEAKVRRHLEQQEEERVRRGRELELQLSQNRQHREQQEAERRRRIEEARIREQERRQQVEERKRQIWEAEQERKEAILRRNMEREARIEARRNAQRNSQCFAFGSSTPRSFDLDLAAIGVQGSVLMCSVSRRPEERELGPPRATSACSLDRKFGEDCMSRSMVSLSSSSTFRGRKRTDILPTMTPRERSTTPHTTPRGNHAMRAVSMTRLDQLAQPRRTYFNHTPLPPPAGPRTVSPSMSKSMCNLANSTPPARTMSRNGGPRMSGTNSRSMLHLPGSAAPRQRLTPSPTHGMRPAVSMLQLAPPRLTRAARLRAEALAGGRAASAWNLSRAAAENGQNGLSGKDSSRSPSRPHSSLSGTSDVSATSSSMSAVQMRPRPAPRRPRPFSVAGSVVDTSTLAQSGRREPERQPRLHDRNASAPAAKPQRAKSANRESSEFKNTKPLIAPRKPVLPPKPTELLSKAKSHPVPIKDNLRKVAKPTNKSTTSAGKPSTDVKDKLDINQNGIDKVDSKKENVPETRQTAPTTATNPSSTVTSPTSYSDMLPTSNASEEVNAESDVDTLSQSITEAKTPTVKTQTVEQSIPKEAPSKEDVPLQIVENGSTKSKEDIPVSMTQSLYVKKEKEDIPALMTTSLVMENGVREFTPPKPRITSEEEARAALAEKRRLAREQAEREAELERQRLEEIKRKEEEERRLEELEQKRMEDEQIRLAELHRQLENEKLAKAIEEQQQREREEQERREEEARQKAEREEQEKKAREEAEKQRLEMEEKLRKEEEERAERKRRVEQIMARTRGKAAAAQSPSNQQPSESKSLTTPSPAEAPKTSLLPQANDESSSKPSPPQESSSKPVSNGHSVNGTSENYVTNSWPFSEEGKPSNGQQPLPDILNSTHHNGGSLGERVSGESGSFTTVSNRTLSANEDVSPQTNGYSSHEEMSCTTSPEESADMGLLIDIQSCQQRSSKVLSESVDFTKLVEVDPPSLDNVVNNENYLINVDDVNSNLFNSANPFVGFEDSLQQKKDAPVTDLLS